MNPKTQNKIFSLETPNPNQIPFWKKHQNPEQKIFFRNTKPKLNSIFQSPNPNHTTNQNQAQILIFSFGPPLVSGGDDEQVWAALEGRCAAVVCILREEKKKKDENGEFEKKRWEWRAR